MYISLKLIKYENYFSLLLILCYISNNLKINLVKQYILLLLNKLILYN